MVNIFKLSGRYDVEGEKLTKARKFPQYAAAFTANFSGLAFGAILAWMAPAGPMLSDGAAGFPVNTYQLSVVGSLMPIGAAISSVPTGYLTDRIGRKTVLLIVVPVAVAGWALIAWATSIEMMYAGRFITGMSGGAFCVAAPVFTAEISQKEIRGELGSYYQLLLSIGVILAFTAGSQLDLFYMSITCLVVPIIFGVGFFFFRETPVYYLTKGRESDALKSLKFYRGARYDYEQEMNELSNTSKRNTEQDAEQSRMDVFLSKAGKKAFCLSIFLMAFQQLCGINACTFYATTIFQDAGSSLEPKYATVILGFMQFGGTVIGMFLVDRLGRVILLGASASAMAFSTFLMGGYFLVKDYDLADPSPYSWLPLFAESLFVVMFAVGYGPIPWALLPEINPSKIVGTTHSVACVVNWTCAFIVTKFFPELVETIGAGVTFFIFTGIGIIAAVFSFAAVPETKGKSLDEIQVMMSR